jgi:hypothetical protein
MKQLTSASGKTTWVTLAIIAGIVTTAYLGWHYGPIYMDDFDVKHAMREAAAYAYREQDDGIVKQRLLKAIAQVGSRYVPQEGGGTKLVGAIDMETVEVQLERKANQHIQIWVQYARNVDWLWIKRRTWVRFNRHVEGDLTPVTWGKQVGGE